MESEFTLFWSDIDKASAHWILETVYTIKTIALINAKMLAKIHETRFFPKVNKMAESIRIQKYWTLK